MQIEQIMYIHWLWYCAGLGFAFVHYVFFTVIFCTFLFEWFFQIKTHEEGSQERSTSCSGNGNYVASGSCGECLMVCKQCNIYIYNYVVASKFNLKRRLTAFICHTQRLKYYQPNLFHVQRYSIENHSPHSPTLSMPHQTRKGCCLPRFSRCHLSLWCIVYFLPRNQTWPLASIGPQRTKLNHIWSRYNLLPVEHGHHVAASPGAVSHV